MKKPMNKLVRDNIPFIIEKDGRIPNIKILNDESYKSALNEKLKEEVKEYLMSNDVEELADIVEVVEALAETQGSSIQEVMEIKHKKQNKNGAFKNKIFLISIDG